MNDNGPPLDHVQPNRNDQDVERPPLGETLKSKTTWMRALFMLIVLILYGISRVVLLAVMLIQLGYVLFTGSTHKPLVTFGKSLAVYSCEIVLYLTFNTESRPFPFDADWPTADSGNGKQSEEKDDRGQEAPEA